MFVKNFKKFYDNKLIIKNLVIRRLWSKPIFSLFFAKTFLENQKMDIYKCPKLVLPKKSWENKKYAIFPRPFSKVAQKQNNVTSIIISVYEMDLSIVTSLAIFFMIFV